MMRLDHFKVGALVWFSIRVHSRHSWANSGVLITLPANHANNANGWDSTDLKLVRLLGFRFACILAIRGQTPVRSSTCPRITPITRMMGLDHFKSWCVCLISNSRAFALFAGKLRCVHQLARESRQQREWLGLDHFKVGALAWSSIRVHSCYSRAGSEPFIFIRQSCELGATGPPAAFWGAGPLGLWALLAEALGGGHNGRLLGLWL